MRWNLVRIPWCGLVADIPPSEAAARIPPPDAHSNRDRPGNVDCGPPVAESLRDAEYHDGSRGVREVGCVSTHKELAVAAAMVKDGDILSSRQKAEC